MNKTTFTTGMICTLFFASVLFIFIPLYIEEAMFMPPNAVASAAWPKAISVLGFAMGLLLIITAFKGNKEAESVDENKFSWVRFLQIIFSFVIFIVATPYLGFVLSSVLLTIFLLVTIQKPIKVLIPAVVGVSFGVVLYFVFTRLVQITFPMGELFESFYG